MRELGIKPVSRNFGGAAMYWIDVTQRTVLSVRRLFAILTLIALAACGGGGGQEALVPMFSTLQPVTLSLDESRSFVVGGGSVPYTASSSNATLVDANITGKTLTIKGKLAGSVTITVYDSTGKSLGAAVTVAPSTLSAPLFVAAPEAVTVALASTSTYSIGGGKPPYTASSSNPSVASASASGSTLTISGNVTGQAQVSVYDASGEVRLINATVGSGNAATTFFMTLPPAVNLAVASMATYTIGGGTAPYSVSTSHPGVANAIVSGTVLTVSASAVGIASIRVYDSTGAVLTGAVTVGAGAPTALFMTAPSAVTLAPNASATYTIGGGTASYSASSSNQAAATATVLGSTLTVTGVAAGSAQITVFDQTGASIGTTVSVGTSAAVDNLYMTAPVAITIAAGVEESYYVGGGVAPYRVSSAKSSVVSAVIDGSTLKVRGVTLGTALVTVFDSTGKSVTTNTTVGTGSAVTNLFVTAPSAVTLASGASANYMIDGGTAPYFASSSNNGVVTTSVSGTTLSVAGLVNGTAQVNVLDSTGALVRIAVTVGSGGADLYMAAPGTIFISPAAQSTFSIGGGAAPYRVSSSNIAVVTAGVVGDILTVTGVGSGTGQVVVFDATGRSVATSVTVGSSTSTSLYVTAPSSVSMLAGTAPTYTIGGGSAPYTVSSSNAAVAVANLVGGNTLSVAGASAGSAQVVVFDANGNSVTVNVVVLNPVGSALFTTAPSSVTVNTGGARDYDIGGGVAPYTAVSSNQSVVTATVTGQTLTISGIAGGTATVTVRDAVNTTITVAVTVGSGNALFTSAPAAVTLAVGATPTYTIGGGAAPYVASSSNASVATVTISSGTLLTITGQAAGAAVVNVLDSTGALVAINVTVGSGGGGGSALFTTAPSPLTVGTGAVSTYLVSGGTGPYSANSSNPAVATSSVSGGTLTINSVANGLANIVVTDSVGARLTVEITVTATATTPLLVTPSAASANVGDILNFSVSGASPPYNISVNNVSVACVSGTASSCSSGGTTVVAATGGSFFATMLNVGATTVAITDSLGQTSTLNLTVNATATTLRLSPSALMVGEDEVRTIVLNVYGGTAPYTAYTSDLVLSNASVVGNVFSTGLGSRGSRCINPVDASNVYIVNGTFDVTLTVVDSLGASATSTLTIKDNGKGLSANGCF